MDVTVCIAGVGTSYGPVCVRVRSFWWRKCYGLGWNLSWWSHSAQNCSRNIECRKIQTRYSWSYRSTLSATAKLWSRLSTWQCKMSHGSCLSRLSEPEPHHVLPWPALYVMENTLQLWILKNNKRDPSIWLFLRIYKLECSLLHNTFPSTTVFILYFYLFNVQKAK
jgi:hypothetical protein